jgi:hypothetical protein
MPRTRTIAGDSLDDDGAARYRIKLYKAVTQLTGDVSPQQQQDDEILRLRRRRAEAALETVTRHAG